MQKGSVPKPLRQQSPRHDILAYLSIRLLIAQNADLPAGAWDHVRLDDTFWRIYQQDSDGGYLITPDYQLALEAGEIYLIPPGLSLASSNCRHIRQFFIHFDLDGISPLVFLSMAPSPALIQSGQNLRERMTELSQRLENEDMSQFSTRCLLVSMIYEVFGLYFADLPDRSYEMGNSRMNLVSPILPSLTYIHDHLEGPQTVSCLAGLCGMSEDYFIRRFREAVGTPPMRYVLKQRTARAAQRLAFTTDPIDQIAEQTGFGDRYYFSRVFTRLTGISPAAYRKRPLR